MSTLRVDAIRHNSATSDAITTAADGTCSAKLTSVGGGGLSHRNVIRNGHMQVIQRGSPLTVNANIARGRTCADGWEISSDTNGTGVEWTSNVSVPGTLEVTSNTLLVGDATLIVPLIKEYLEISVKNDEQLIKMATIIQRALQNVGEDGEFGISDEEKAELLEEMERLEKLSKENNKNGD